MHNPLAFDPEPARAVRADTLEAVQQQTPRPFRIATDFRQQWMLKHPHRSEFHSRAEHLHAALLEADPSVLAYVPQPFRLRIGAKRYTPDCYIVSESAPRRVVELKPGGEMAEQLRVPLIHFFAAHGMQFTVVSNESIFERELEAENWVEIVRILHQARAFDTTIAEYDVLDRLAEHASCSVGDLVDPGDRERTYCHEIALFRLLHRGQLRAALTERPLDYDTGIWPCT